MRCNLSFATNCQKTYTRAPLPDHPTMRVNASLAYQQLQPDDILSAVESLGFECDGRLLALNSYENRVYRVGLTDEAPLVAKFYRPGRWPDEAIQEEHDFAEELAAHEIPVVPPLRLAGQTLHRHADFRFSVQPCHGGYAPALDNLDLLRQLGRLVGRIHQLGQRRSFTRRPSISLENFGANSAAFLLENDFVPAHLQTAYESLCEDLFKLITDCYARAGTTQPLRLHGDFHPGNVLVLEQRVHIVDLDDARMGPSVQDLWMFLSGDRGEQTPQLDELLGGYSEFAHFNTAELHLIEALRTLRMMHYAAWLARRWQDPAFKSAFPWFDTVRYWDEHVLSLREQAAAMSEPPLEWLQ